VYRVGGKFDGVDRPRSRAKAKAAREEDEPGEEESEAKLVIEVEVCSVFKSFMTFIVSNGIPMKQDIVECLNIIPRDGEGRFRDERSKSF
jgi:hypothetical protein